MKRDREMEREGRGGEALYTKRLGQTRGERRGKGQTEMLREERQMENDRCELDDVGENHKGGGSVQERMGISKGPDSSVMN